MFIAALFAIDETTQVFTEIGMDKHSVVYPYNGMKDREP